MSALPSCLHHWYCLDSATALFLLLPCVHHCLVFTTALFHLSPCHLHLCHVSTAAFSSPTPYLHHSLVSTTTLSPLPLITTAALYPQLPCFYSQPPSCFRQCPVSSKALPTLPSCFHCQLFSSASLSPPLPRLHNLVFITALSLLPPHLHLCIFSVSTLSLPPPYLCNSLVSAPAFFHCRLVSIAAYVYRRLWQ